MVELAVGKVHVAGRIEQQRQAHFWAWLAMSEGAAWCPLTVGHKGPQRPGGKACGVSQVFKKVSYLKDLLGVA